MNRIIEWIDHNQGLAFALVICVGLLAWVYGCASTVPSIQDPARMVTRAELEAEVQNSVTNFESQLDLLEDQAEAKFTQLDRRDEIKQKLFGLAAESASTGIIDPTKIITTLGFILLGGAAVDNRAKDKVIKTQKNNSK